MKNKDIQKVVKTKYENGDSAARTYRDLARAVSLPTIKLWIKMMNTTGTDSITLSLFHPSETTHQESTTCQHEYLNYSYEYYVYLHLFVYFKEYSF